MELGIWTMRFCLPKSRGRRLNIFMVKYCQEVTASISTCRAPEASWTFRTTWNVKMEHCMESATTKAAKRHLEMMNARGGHWEERSCSCGSPAPEVLSRAPGMLQGADPVEVMLAPGPGTISDQWTGVRKVSASALNQTSFLIKSCSLSRYGQLCNLLYIGFQLYVISKR